MASARGTEPGGEADGDTQPRVYELARIPASAGAVLRDRRGRLLILKPTYKAGWTIPGGVIEADGEAQVLADAHLPIHIQALLDRTSVSRLT